MCCTSAALSRLGPKLWSSYRQGAWARCACCCAEAASARAMDRRWGSRPAAWVFHQQWASGENAALGTLSMASWYTAGESCHSVSPITRRERRERPSRRVKSRGTAVRRCRLGPAWRAPPGYWAQRRCCRRPRQIDPLASVVGHDHRLGHGNSDAGHQPAPRVVQLIGQPDHPRFIL